MHLPHPRAGAGTPAVDLLLIITAAAPLAVLSPAAPALARTTYLRADFDLEPLDTPIGTGGPGVGQPVSVDESITAIVRGAPMPSPCLEITDIDDYAAGTVRFELLGGAEIASGRIAISLNLRFDAVAPGHAFVLGVRERDGSVFNFATVDFSDSGEITLGDENSTGDLIGSWNAGRRIGIGLDFDMDGRTYDVWLGDTLVRDDASHGIAAAGIGALYVGCLHDPDLEGRVYVDDILVSDVYTPAPVAPGSWGAIKGLYR